MKIELIAIMREGRISRNVRLVKKDGENYGTAYHSGIGWYFKDVAGSIVLEPSESHHRMKKEAVRVKKIDGLEDAATKAIEAGHWPKPSEAVAARDARNARVADLKAKQEAQDRLERAAPALLRAALQALKVMDGRVHSNAALSAMDDLRNAVGQAEGTVEAPPRPEFADA